MSQLIRLWYFSSSVNSFYAHAQPWSGARSLIYGWTLRLLPYFMCANSEGSGETVWIRRLARAFAGRLCDKYHNLMSWLLYPSRPICFYSIQRASDRARCKRTNKQQRNRKWPLIYCLPPNSILPILFTVIGT